jgi:hypothetical protein
MEVSKLQMSVTDGPSLTTFPDGKVLELKSDGEISTIMDGHLKFLNLTVTATTSSPKDGLSTPSTNLSNKSLAPPTTSLANSLTSSLASIMPPERTEPAALPLLQAMLSGTTLLLPLLPPQTTQSSTSASLFNLRLDPTPFNSMVQDTVTISVLTLTTSSLPQSTTTTSTLLVTTSSKTLLLDQATGSTLMVVSPAGKLTELSTVTVTMFTTLTGPQAASSVSNLTLQATRDTLKLSSSLNSSSTNS